MSWRREEVEVIYSPVLDQQHCSSIHYTELAGSLGKSRGKKPKSPQKKENAATIAKDC